MFEIVLIVIGSIFLQIGIEKTVNDDCECKAKNEIRNNF